MPLPKYASILTHYHTNTYKTSYTYALSNKLDNSTHHRFIISN